MDKAMQKSNGVLVVAIVEDDPRIQQLLLAEIQDEGHNGVIFNSAEDFLENSSAQSFDLVLLDLMLPGIDGLACLKRIQNKAVDASPPRAVIMTALNDATKKQEALRGGRTKFDASARDDPTQWQCHSHRPSHCLRRCRKVPPPLVHPRGQQNRDRRALTSSPVRDEAANQTHCL
jgi:CheY-like chemotaxis protein